MKETFDNYDQEVPEGFPDMGNSHYLLVYPVAIEAKTTKGLLLGESGLEQVQNLLSYGKVVAKGRMCYMNKVCLHPVTGEYLHWCEIGDWVSWSRATSDAHAAIFGGKRFWIIPDINILCKIDDPDKVDPRYKLAGR